MPKISNKNNRVQQKKINNLKKKLSTLEYRRQNKVINIKKNFKKP